LFSTTTPSATPLAPSDPLPPSAFISFNHCAGKGSATPTLSVFASPLTVVSPTQLYNSTFPLRSSTRSLPGLELCVDLSRYSLPRQTSLVRSPASPAPHGVRPRQYNQHHFGLYFLITDFNPTCNVSSHSRAS
jgi:hypothetical protein